MILPHTICTGISAKDCWQRYLTGSFMLVGLNKFIRLTRKNKLK